MDQPMLYSDIMSAAIIELEGAGLDCAPEIAHSIACTFCREHKHKIYRVPSLQAMTKVDRDQLMFEDRKTMSVKQIARKYDLTENRVYMLLRETQAA